MTYRITEIKRNIWLTGLITKENLNTMANILGSHKKAYNFALSISRLLKSFFQYIIWPYRNKSFKLKEESLRINLKQMVFYKKKTGRKTRVISHSNSIFVHDTSQVHQVYQKSLITKMQRIEWASDLVNIAIRGKIE